MAWYHRKRADMSAKIPIPRVPTPGQLVSYVKKLIRANQTEFYELEPLEVTRVLLDGEYNGVVDGNFLNNPGQELLGGGALPLFPNMKQIPLVGEHVLVAEYNGQHYYFGVINRKNSINENAVPDVAKVLRSGSGDRKGVVKANRPKSFGKVFRSSDVRPPDLNEGEIVHSGRFGQSIKFGCNPENLSPIIKISCGDVRKANNNGKIKVGPYGTPIKQNLDTDGSSIYLVDDGLPFDSGKDADGNRIEPSTKTGTFDGGQIRSVEQLRGDTKENFLNKRILIKSDGVYLSGRGSIRLNSPGTIRFTSQNLYVSNSNICLGQGQGVFDSGTSGGTINSVVRGEDLKDFLVEIIDMLDGIESAFSKASKAFISAAPASPVVGDTAAAIFKGIISSTKTSLKSKLKTNTMLSKTVRTV